MKLLNQVNGKCKIIQKLKDLIVVTTIGVKRVIKFVDSKPKRIKHQGNSRIDATKLDNSRIGAIKLGNSRIDAT